MATNNFTLNITTEKINARLAALCSEAESADPPAELSRDELAALTDQAILRGVDLANIAYVIGMLGSEEETNVSR